MKAINLKATTANGVETFEIFDEPNADFCTSIASFLGMLQTLEDGEVAYYQVMPSGTDGQYELIDAEYGIH